LIVVEDIWVKFGSKEVLKGLNLEIPEGKTTVILGRSGIGKSVLLKCILGLLQPISGRIFIDDKEFLSASKAQKKELTACIGMLLQNGALFDSMNVEDNIAFPLAYHKRATPTEIKKKVYEYAELVGIRDSLHLMPKDLSGGMRRKVALARAIMLHPRYLFYDEPTTGLDPTSSAIVEILIRQLKEQLNITTLVVTHDIELVKFLGEDVALLEDGKILYKEAKTQAFKEESPIFQSFIASRERIQREQGFSNR
jgi:phospholipid/cholesterol/gamma-HCH transport system ATP-binding protein